MSRLKGNAVPLSTLKNGASALVDLSQDLVSYEWVDGDGNQVTFADFAAGTPTQLNCTFVLDFAATSAHEYLWNNSGAVAVSYVLQPRGATVSQDNPKFSGTLDIPATKPRWGNSGSESDYATFDVEFPVNTFAKAIS